LLNVPWAKQSTRRLAQPDIRHVNKTVLDIEVVYLV